MKKLAFVTGNESKVTLLTQRLKGFAEVHQLNPEIKEVQAKDAEEVCQNKLHAALAFLKRTRQESIYDGIICEDGGLHLDVLSGNPGIYSKYFLDGLPEEEQEHMLNLITHTAHHFGRTKGRYTNCLGYMEKSGQIHLLTDTFTGRVHHKVKEKSGKKMWGCSWRIFILDGYNKTMSEMTDEEWQSFVELKAKRWESLKNLITS